MQVRWTVLAWRTPSTGVCYFVLLLPVVDKPILPVAVHSGIAQASNDNYYYRYLYFSVFVLSSCPTGSTQPMMVLSSLSFLVGFPCRCCRWCYRCRRDYQRRRSLSSRWWEAGRQAYVRSKRHVGQATTSMCDHKNSAINRQQQQQQRFIQRMKRNQQPPAEVRNKMPSIAKGSVTSIWLLMIMLQVCWN